MKATRLPVMFIGHGSPMNAIEDNEFSRAWIEAGKILPTPKAILSISAHWETQGTQVTAMVKPRTIYDFYGFPPELYSQAYPAPGDPGLAREIQDLIGKEEISLDVTWGLDHGTWSVMKRLFPDASVPVLQLSLDLMKNAQAHYDLGQKLLPLRDEGILIIGSGNIVHNLRMVVFEDKAYPWAQEFDEKVKKWIQDGNHEPIIHYEKQGMSAELAINSAEHYKPLLYVLGMKVEGEPVSYFVEKVWGGSISMRALRIG